VAHFRTVHRRVPLAAVPGQGPGTSATRIVSSHIREGVGEGGRVELCTRKLSIK
jgi:hypothetical protein